MLVLNLCLTLFTLLVGTSSVHAEPADNDESTPAIVNHIKEVQDNTVKMASVVEKWSGDILMVLPIWTASDAIVDSIEDGTKTAQNSDKMSLGEALEVEEATEELLKHTESSMDTILLSKQLFNEAGLISILLSRFEKTRQASEDLNAAVVDKLPGAGKSAGRELGERISAAFDSAIAELSKET